MNKFKQNHTIIINIKNLSDENSWAMKERYELDMKLLFEDKVIDNKYKVIYKKAKMLKLIQNFLEIKYSEF